MDDPVRGFCWRFPFYSLRERETRVDNWTGTRTKARLKFRLRPDAHRRSTSGAVPLNQVRLISGAVPLNQVHLTPGAVPLNQGHLTSGADPSNMGPYPGELR